jgi:deoxycytidylate deaminase
MCSLWLTMSVGCGRRWPSPSSDFVPVSYRSEPSWSTAAKVVASAHTQERRQRRLLVHAELLALDEADRVPGLKRPESVLYTTVEPCLMCMGAAMTTMVGSVAYALPF